MNRKQMEAGISLLLKGLGVDEKSANYFGTPKRVAKMYQEMLSPKENNWTTFPTTHSDLVLLRGHKVICLCPHHLMPVVVTCFVGYIPGERTLGLSKLARALEQHLTQPILQEDLAHQVAVTLEERLKPKGVGVVTKGVHGCMSFRGIRTEGDVIVSSMKGVLLLNPAARSEFLHLVGVL
jgi:GTP cyclohydrolase I